MNKALKATLAALLVAGTSQAAHAQVIGDQNTSITGNTIYVEEDTVAYEQQSGNNGLTISGAVGLPLNPTAQIPAVGSWQVQANYFDLFDAETTDASIYGLYAATRMGDAPLEISVGVEKLSSDNDVLDIDRTGFAVGAKYLVTGEGEDPDAIRIAVGAGYSSALYKNTHAYVVASKAFTAGSRVITAHVGARWDRFSLGVLDLDSSKVSLYSGLEVPIDNRGRFNLIGEIGTKNANDELGGATPYSVSLRYRNGSGFAASAGVARQGVLSKFANDDHSGARLFAQIGKTF